MSQYVFLTMTAAKNSFAKASERGRRMQDPTNDGKRKSHEGRLSKAAHIWLATLAYAVPIGVILGIELHKRGALSPTVLIALAVGSCISGVAFGIGAWHLWFKRHQL